VKNSLEDPTWGTRVFWLPRRNSIVTIKNALRVWNDRHQTEDPVPVTFTLPRGILAILIPSPSEGKTLGAALIEPPEITSGLYTLAVWGTLTLWDVARNGTASRKRTLPLAVFPFPRTHFSIHRVALPVFTRFFTGDVPALPFRADEAGHRSFEEEVRATPLCWEAAHQIDSSPPWNHLAWLTFSICFWLLPLRTLSQIVLPARSKASTASPSPSDISAALFICQLIAEKR
jgi:hypothetical protein